VVLPIIKTWLIISFLLDFDIAFSTAIAFF
jgi:hypothetical protein